MWGSLGVQLSEALSKLWEQQELPFLKPWSMAEAGAHTVGHLCPNRKGTTFSELLQFSFSLEMKVPGEPELTSCGEMEVWWEGHQWHFTAHCCALTLTVPWKTPLLSKPKAERTTAIKTEHLGFKEKETFNVLQHPCHSQREKAKHLFWDERHTCTSAS